MGDLLVPGWCGSFIGKPFVEVGRDYSGFDCYGLIYLIYRDVRNISLPRYENDYATIAEHESVAAAVRKEKARVEAWAHLPIERPVQEFDILIFRIKGLPFHCGVVLQAGWMIHTLKGMNCAIERYDGPLWRRRLLTIHRYRLSAPVGSLSSAF